MMPDFEVASRTSSKRGNDCSNRDTISTGCVLFSSRLLSCLNAARVLSLVPLSQSSVKQMVHPNAIIRRSIAVQSGGEYAAPTRAIKSSTNHRSPPSALRGLKVRSEERLQHRPLLEGIFVFRF